MGFCVSSNVVEESRGCASAMEDLVVSKISPHVTVLIGNLLLATEYYHGQSVYYVTFGSCFGSEPYLYGYFLLYVVEEKRNRHLS